MSKDPRSGIVARMGLFCMHCWCIRTPVDVIHQIGCPNRGSDLPDADAARAALPYGGEWLPAEYLVNRLRVTDRDGSNPREMSPDAVIWHSPLLGGDGPAKSTLAWAFEHGSSEATIGSPHEPGAVPIAVETAVRRAERLGRLWASGARGEARPNEEDMGCDLPDEDVAQESSDPARKCVDCGAPDKAGAVYLAAVDKITGVVGSICLTCMKASAASKTLAARFSNFASCEKCGEEGGGGEIQFASGKQRRRCFSCADLTGDGGSR